LKFPFFEGISKAVILSGICLKVKPSALKSLIASIICCSPLWTTTLPEIEALEKIWIPKSATYKHLIIDVLNNHGGNLPVPYYQILFKGNFQEH
jgi:hypothetical protein